MIFDPIVIYQVALFLIQEAGEMSSWLEVGKLGLGYLLITALLVPMIKWLLQAQSKQAESREKILALQTESIFAQAKAREALLQLLVQQAGESTQALLELRDSINETNREDARTHAQLSKSQEGIVSAQASLLDKLTSIENSLISRT